MALRSVLILTYHFPPSSASGAFRMLGFARHLPRHGWRAVVVAPPTLPWEPVDAELSKQVPAETAVYHVPYTKRRVVRKVALYACWLPRAARGCMAAISEQEPEAILTSGPPHQVHWLGLWLKRRYGLPWLADFRDPWYPEGRMEYGRGLQARSVRVQEAAVFGAADVVIANAPNACKAMADDYPAHRSKFVMLPNGYDREKFETLACAPRVRPPGGPARVVHAGAIYAGRDPRPLLDAVKSISNQVELNFYGPPPETTLDLSCEIDKRGLKGRVLFHGQVPYARALREMARADVLLLMDTPGRTVGVPAKAYEYIGAGRPVLALAERGGDLATVLEQSGVRHRIASPSDPAAIAQGLSELACESSAPAPARTDPHRFSRESIAGRLAELLDRTTHRGTGQGGHPAGDPARAGSPTAYVEC